MSGQGHLWQHWAPTIGIGIGIGIGVLGNVFFSKESGERVSYSIAAVSLELLGWAITSPTSVPGHPFNYSIFSSNIRKNVKRWNSPETCITLIVGRPYLTNFIMVLDPKTWTLKIPGNVANKTPIFSNQSKKMVSENGGLLLFKLLMSL